MDEFFGYLIIPSFFFMTVLGPVWVTQHYSTKRKLAQTLLDDEEQSLEQLLTSLNKMESRLDTLEKILSNEDPNWKDKVE